jgi:glycosyltransferase involved in cell wall biosynthesis
LRIALLYSEIMGYTEATLNALAPLCEQVLVVHWDHKKLSRYAPVSFPANIDIRERSRISDDDLAGAVADWRPDFTVVSGWMDRAYLAAARRLRAAGGDVAVAFDTLWEGTLRQRAMMAASRSGWRARHFTHAWVAGMPQYEVARRMGFPAASIATDLYAADIGRFLGKSGGAGDRRQFLFVGRLEDVKGLASLVDAWTRLAAEYHGWTLKIIGDGRWKERLSGLPAVEMVEFVQPDRLLAEAASAGCFVLPSLREPWGVVVHEFAAFGLPILASDAVGSASRFVVDGWNGFMFPPGDAGALYDAMRAMIATSPERRAAMGRASTQLAQSLTPESSARRLVALARARKEHAACAA